ncbi:hypothetical protein HRbin13_00712 [bacterium HR13]|nr:hypothetical protein HRbin13_00712 [bacterium HR13]
MFFLVLMLCLVAYAQDCASLMSRYTALEKDAIYEELMSEADKLIKDGCSTGNKKLQRSADKILSALEVLKVNDARLPEDKKLLNVVVQKRLRNALYTLNASRKYKDKHSNLYSYQLLFYQVAKENIRVKDYEYALRYSQASYLLGRAILELR